MKSASKILWIITWSLWFLLTSWLILRYLDLPEIVPIHMNLKGEFDSYASKETIFFLPVINLALLVPLMFLSKKVAYLNFPMEITDENRTSAYAQMRLFLAIFALIISIIFFIIAYLFYSKP